MQEVARNKHPTVFSALASYGILRTIRITWRIVIRPSAYISHAHSGQQGEIMSGGSLVWEEPEPSPSKSLSLESHEAKSQARYESLSDKLDSIKEKEMSEGINTDKVIVNAGGGGEGMGSMAALVAALGNRNEGSDNAALIAALGNRNDGSGMSAMLPALMAGGMNGGMNSLWPILLLALLRGRGGLGGDEGGSCEGNIGRELILSKLGTIEGAVPLVGSQVENSICRAEAAITNQVNQVGLAQLAATNGVKDSVQNTATLLLGAGSQNTKEILGAICSLSSKIDANQIMDLQRQLGVSQSEAAEERNARRVRDVEVSVTQNVTQSQAQAQAQVQTQDLLRTLMLHICEGNQIARATNQMITVGSTGTVGNQAANPTNVRA